MSFYEIVGGIAGVLAIAGRGEGACADLTPSLRAKRSNPACFAVTKKAGLLRRCAPRNDGVRVARPQFAGSTFRVARSMTTRPFFSNLSLPSLKKTSLRSAFGKASVIARSAATKQGPFV